MRPGEPFPFSRIWSDATVPRRGRALRLLRVLRRLLELATMHGQLIRVVASSISAEQPILSGR
jgi:hypothetical protein